MGEERTSDFLPSRKDENYRYTQISFNDTKWDSEKLTNSQKGDSTIKPWISDFYLQAFEGYKSSKVLPPKSEEWIYLHSQAEGEKTRGASELIIPKGKNYKVFEFLDHKSERSLLMRNIVVSEGATLEYFFLQDQSLSNTFIVRHFFDLAPGAKVNFRFYHTGAKKGQHRIAAKVEKDSEFIIEGASRLSDAQHVDVWAENEHVGAHSHSQTTVWNVLSDQAVAIFNGMIRIVPNCPQTRAYQSNKTLLLSEKARVHTLPKLEIATDDVKCSHGASVSSLDDNQLFYLESRGINKEAAEKMLIDAFTQPVLRFLPKHLVSAKLQEELNLRGDEHAF
jgi:Fe-S cluster assembly scaffold protein SufB